MPLFQLTCKACGMIQEKFLWDYQDPTTEPCPYCDAGDNEELVLEDYAWEYLASLGCG